VRTNLDPGSPIWLKPGPFADLSREEFVSTYLPKSSRPLASAPAAERPFPPPAAYPSRSEAERHKGPPPSVDWVEAGDVTPIKSQGKVRLRSLGAFAALLLPPGQAAAALWGRREGLQVARLLGWQGPGSAIESWSRTLRKAINAGAGYT
jgi:hypothetical protein